VPVPDDLRLDETAVSQPDVDERLLADQRDQSVREALSRLPRQWQRLAEKLMPDPLTSGLRRDIPLGTLAPGCPRVTAQAPSSARTRAY
jgi:hypothetical protein